MSKASLNIKKFSTNRVSFKISSVSQVGSDDEMMSKTVQLKIHYTRVLIKSVRGRTECINCQIKVKREL